MSIQHVIPSLPSLGTSGSMVPYQVVTQQPFTVAQTGTTTAFSADCKSAQQTLLNMPIAAGSPAITAAAPYVLTLSSSVLGAGNILAYIVGAAGTQLTGTSNSLNIAVNGTTGPVLGVYTTTLVIGNSGVTTGALAAADNVIRILLQQV